MMKYEYLPKCAKTSSSESSSTAQHLGCMVSIFNTFEKLGLGAPTEVQLHNCIPCNIDHVCPISSNPMFDNKRRQCGTQWQCGSTSEEVKETMCVEC